MKEDALSIFPIPAMQNTQIIMLRVNFLGINEHRLRSGFNFCLLTVWDAPSSAYEIPMGGTYNSNWF